MLFLSGNVRSLTTLPKIKEDEKEKRNNQEEKGSVTAVISKPKEEQSVKTLKW